MQNSDNLMSESISEKIVYRCAVIKAKENLVLPPSLSEDINRICEEFLAVWALHKLHCGKVIANSCVVRPDPIPQKQYRYPKEAEPSIFNVIKSLLEQDVITEMQSRCNASV